MHRRILLIGAMMLLVAGLAFADPATPSNTSRVTGTIFEEPNDLYLDILGFTMLESNYVFLQFDMPSGPGVSFYEIGGTTTKLGPYIGGLFQAYNIGTQGLLGSNEASTVDIDELLNLDANNQIIGKTQVRTSEAHASVSTSNNLQTLVGLGNIGVFVQAFHLQDNDTGSFDAGYAFPAGTAVGNILIGGNDWLGGTGPVSSQATVTTTTDAAGTIVSVDSTEYGEGTAADSTLQFELSGGLPLALGGMTLGVGGGVVAAIDNGNASSAVETFSRAVGADYTAAYTPAQTLSGDVSAAIEDLTDYEYRAASGTESGFGLDPFVFAELTLPLNEAVEATAGAQFTTDFTFGSASYVDTAGAEQSVNGRAASYERVDVSVGPNPDDPTLTETVTTTDRAWNTVQEGAFDQQEIELGFGVAVTPSEMFRFGVHWTPVVTLSGTTSVYDGAAVRTVVTDNGDGADGLGDSVTETSVARAGYTETVSGFSFDNELNTAAQFYLTDRIRVNLGASYQNMLIDRTVTEVVTLGVAQRTERQALLTTTPPADETGWTVTNYVADDEVRDATVDASQTLVQTGDSEIRYEGGFTFFFSDTMFLDLRMDANGGDIWSTNEWSLEMTIEY